MQAGKNNSDRSGERHLSAISYLMRHKCSECGIVGPVVVATYERRDSKGRRSKDRKAYCPVHFNLIVVPDMG